MTVVIDRTKTNPDAAGKSSVADRVRDKAKGSGGLYKPRTPIYPKKVNGRWRTIKWAMLVATLAVYWITPWIRWDRPGNAPDQAVLVDFTHGRFYFFFIQLWPQEGYFITGLLVLAALSLFLVSSLFGRLWCGYACPQTVWTDLFLFVERQFEGDRNAHMRRDAGKMTFDTLWRKVGKHAVWLGISFATGGAWIFYFHDAPHLIQDFWVGRAPMTAYISCGILTVTTYALAGTMREQVCTYLCPWPRIQSAMLDSHTLQVTYRKDRGEPRGPHKKGASWEGRGDCVDCNQCVVVCPMGIDIRDGAHLECINCGLCVDACDEMMLRVGRPQGLIAYDTDAAAVARSQGQAPKLKLIRPRTVFYAAALTGVAGLMLTGLLTRADTELHVIHDRNPMFVRLHDGTVRNGYVLKISNRTFFPRTFQLTLDGAPDAQMKMAGEGGWSRSMQIPVGPDQVRTVRLFAAVPGGSLHDEEEDIAFVLQGARHPIRVSSNFATGEGEDR